MACPTSPRLATASLDTNSLRKRNGISSTQVMKRRLSREPDQASDSTLAYWTKKPKECVEAERQFGWHYKLGPNQYGLDIALPDQLDVDEKRMAVRILFADGNRRDGVGDLLEVTGIRTERHRRNPIVLFDHGKQVQLPIGLAEDPQTKAYTVEVDPVSKTAWANTFFYQGSSLEGLGSRLSPGNEFEHALFCEQLFDLIVKRFVRAGSIGYQVVKGYQLPPDFERGTPKGLHLIETLMLELSAVVLPANGDTVRKALALPEVCGKKLSPLLIKSLEPYAAPKKAQLGYEGKSNRGEVMSEDTKIKAMDEAQTPEEMNGDGMETKEEPLGAQVLRMLHEDFKMVLQNYDSVMGMLEHAGVRKMLERNLTMVEKVLSEVETAFTKEYPELPGLEDAMDMKDEDLGETEREMEEPTAEEAVEGMQKKELTPEQTKELRLKYRQKNMCPECGMDPCKCTKAMCPECGMSPCKCSKAHSAGMDKEEYEDDLELHEKRMVGEARTYLGEISSSKTFTDEQRMNAYHYYKMLEGMVTLEEAHSKVEYNLGNHDVPPATWTPGAGAKGQPSDEVEPAKARQILHDGEVNGKPLTEDQRRMFGAAASRGEKSLNDGESGDSPSQDMSCRAVTSQTWPCHGKPHQNEHNKGTLEVKQKAHPGTPEWVQEEMRESEHKEKKSYRKMLKDCSVFLKRLSSTTLLTDEIREKAGYWHRSMEMMTDDERRAGAAGPGQTPAAMDAKAEDEPDTKALKELFTKQFGDLTSLNEKLARLVAV